MGSAGSAAGWQQKNTAMTRPRTDVSAALLILLAACGSAPAKNVDLPALMAKLPLAQEDRDEMMELDAADLMTYYGIAEADVKQFAALMHTSGIDCDEIVLIEAADSAAASPAGPPPIIAIFTFISLSICLPTLS